MRRFTYSHNYEGLYSFLLAGFASTNLIFFGWHVAELESKILRISIFSIMIIIIGVLLYRYFRDKMRIDTLVEAGKYKAVEIHEIVEDGKAGFYFRCIDRDTQQSYETDNFEDPSEYKLDVNDLLPLYTDNDIYWIKLEKVGSDSTLTTEDKVRSSDLKSIKKQSAENQKLLILINAIISIVWILYASGVVLLDLHVRHSYIQTEAVVREVSSIEYSSCYSSSRCLYPKIILDVIMPPGYNMRTIRKYGIDIGNIYVYYPPENSPNQRSQYNTGERIRVYANILGDHDFLRESDVRIQSDFDAEFTKKLGNVFFAFLWGSISIGVWVRDRGGVLPKKKNLSKR